MIGPRSSSGRASIFVQDNARCQIIIVTIHFGVLASNEPRCVKNIACYGTREPRDNVHVILYWCPTCYFTIHLAIKEMLLVKYGYVHVKDILTSEKPPQKMSLLHLVDIFAPNGRISIPI
ncbi:uncharacterized protein CANTADRAFT_25171 [Suhomyces tanzawaensis NRRL Y-17324]|uniref:Uncharacterized protein n=1 Tax=Suhomyces tanzawaensis NRRL Y-17324 TaxID=984487 RepID=A0A1E4SMW3_9ASCO|nr:uncharacterized protein CANTADRAFT_25171 [Suhomyces tanzawaensis NRRL Y-17324]ODV80757.1 hypothetical protein CANTADRAFT_25171 [Suhomyces tanzawaensis NRRL Y-17324]